MPLDRHHLRLLDQAVRTPNVWVPAAVGAAAIGLWALNRPMTPVPLWLGIAGLAIAAAVAAHRLWSRWHELSRAAMDRIHRDAVEDAVEELAGLQSRMFDAGDRDGPRRVRALVEQSARLRRLRATLSPFPEDVCAQVQSLWNACVHSLDRSVALWTASLEIRTPATRDAVLNARDDLLREVDAGTSTLTRALDGLQAGAVLGDSRGEAVTAIAADLDRSLRIAGEVERRMAELEASLHKTLGHRDRR
jgi:hypothetical protein